jgi:hypothetical protein
MTIPCSFNIHGNITPLPLRIGLPFGVYDEIFVCISNFFHASYTFHIVLIEGFIPRKVNKRNGI